VPLRAEPPDPDDRGEDDRLAGGAEAGLERDYSPELAELAGELEALIERVEELSMAILREALARGARERPQAERRVSRVRNALVRALAILER
jgi:hypothetical protein